MELATETVNGDAAVVVGVPVDHLDAGNTKDFKAAMDPLLLQYTTVILNLESVQFIDSSGLGSLLSCLRTVNGRNGELRLFGMSKPVQAMFELVRMHRLFAIYNTREEALATL